MTSKRRCRVLFTIAFAARVAGAASGRRAAIERSLLVAPSSARRRTDAAGAESVHPMLTDRPPNQERRREPGNGLSYHILPASATMIGVCMTVLSIGHLGPAGQLRVWLDKLIAVDALIFLVSAATSFVSMRQKARGARYEARAEAIFIAGLGVLALGAVLLAFAIQ